MLNVFNSEIRKLKNDKMAITGFIIIVLLPVLLIIKGFFIDKGNINSDEWQKQVIMILSTVLPVINGLVITRLIQSEYQNGTIKNVLCVPVHRSSFVTGKAAVWLSWYLISAVSAAIISVIGLLILYPDYFFGGWLFFALSIIKTAVIIFAAYTPVLWIAFLQKGTFYPSMIATLLLTVIQLAGSQVTEKMLPVASCIPWTAVTILNLIDSSSPYYAVCIISILASFFIGIEISVFNFSRQEF